MPYLCIDRHNHRYYKPINPYCKGVRGNWGNVFFDWCGDAPARNMFARNRALACHACLKKYPVDISSARLKRSGTRLGFAYARLAKCRRFRGVA